MVKGDEDRKMYVREPVSDAGTGSATETEPKRGLDNALVWERVGDVLHIRIDSGIWPFPRLRLQPPLRLELVRVFTPERLITTESQTDGFSDQDGRTRREAYRLDAATETTAFNPLGTGTSVITFPEIVVMGLYRGSTSSAMDFL